MDLPDMDDWEFEEIGREWQFSELRDQARDGDTDVVLAAVDAEPGLATRFGIYDYTLLHEACGGGHVDLVRGLLDRKANIHQRDHQGWDALMYASVHGRVPVLELLISRGADVNAISKLVRTALAWAALNDNLPACLYLISQKADLLSVDIGGESVLELYGQFKGISISEEIKKQHTEILREAWLNGPHPSQCWARRCPMMMVVTAHHNLTGIAIFPLAYRQALMLIANPPLPPDAEIPPLQLDTPEKRRNYYLNRIFGDEGIFKLIMSFL